MNTNNFEKNDLRASNPLCGLIFPMSLCHLYALMFYLYVLVCHSYISHMCSYVIRKLLVCTRMLSVYHPYVFLCHPYVTHMYSYVICMSLVCGFTIKVLGETLCLHEEKLIICSTQSYQCLFPVFLIRISSPRWFPLNDRGCLYTTSSDF